MGTFLSHTLSLFVLGVQVAIASHSISWFPCPPSASVNGRTDGDVPLICGSLAVPLDYTSSNTSETIQLQITKVSATKQPSKGSILLNPGGPGTAGADVFEEGPAESLLLLSGGSYDLIAFNTRGTGQTLPFSCFESDQARKVASALTPIGAGGSNTALEELWAAKVALAQLCFGVSNKTGDLIGTAFTARDMMQIVDALGEDGLLRYWGFSYGTVLGMTAAAMFPDRVDRMVLDGCENFANYYAGNGLTFIPDADAALSGFFQGCIEAPKLCPLAAKHTTARDLEDKVFALLRSLKYDPIPAPSGLTSGTLVIDYNYFQQFLFSTLYFPTLWQYGAAAIAELSAGNATGFLTYAALATSGAGSSIADRDSSSPEATWGIECADSSIRATALRDLAPLVNATEAESRWFGTVQVVNPLLTCAPWKMRSKEVYNGSFANIRTRNPILFVSNTVDPVTPLMNARNNSAAFEESVVLQNDGYGHTSDASPSLCTAQHVQLYFLNGTLPAHGSVCQHSYKTFDTPSSYLAVTGIVAALGPTANITNTTFGKS